jgi:hypothetical protein
MTRDEMGQIWILRDLDSDEHHALYYRFGGDFSRDCRQAFPFDSRTEAEHFAARYQLRHGFGLTAETLLTAWERG